VTRSDRVYPELDAPWLAPRRLKRAGIMLLLVIFYAISLRLAQVDVNKLLTGLPKIASWALKAWPPATRELDVLLLRAAETVAMAAIGTTIATILALALCIFAAQPDAQPAAVLPGALAAQRPARDRLFCLRAAVRRGGRSGAVRRRPGGRPAHLGNDGQAVHRDDRDSRAGLARGRRTHWRQSSQGDQLRLLPDILPSIASLTLFWWEFNVRASTVLGVVGAGGIGQELKNSMDLLDFPQLLTIILIILVMVTAIDQLSAWLRRRLT
jgi:phosphonate transport system permease protein